MIHFDFVVTDEEAETIFSAIEDELSRDRTKLLFGDSVRKDWYRERIAYLEELKKKMTNSKIS